MMNPHMPTIAFPDDNRVRPTSEKSPRACSNCVRAKTRCSFVLVAGTKCERCRRMKKDCRPPPPVRKRRIVTKQPTSKVERLEKKIDGLFNFLKSTTVENGQPSSSADTASSDSVINATPLNTTSHAERLLSPHPRNDVSHDSFGLPNPTTAASMPVDLYYNESTLEPSPENAEIYLINFRTNFINNFPFLVIPLSVTAYRLRQERPILWLCIMSVASKNTNEQIILSRRVKEVFGMEAYVRGTRNLDFLLGVLVFATWDRRLGFDRSILTSVVQLAIAIMSDLELDRSHSTDIGFTLMRSVKGETVSPSQAAKVPTMEERRASLGCFLLSTLSPSLRKGQSLRWTSHFNDCLRVLQEEKACKNDLILAQMVNFRLISEKVIDFNFRDLTRQGHFTTIPASFYVKSLEAELRECIASIPSGLVDDKVLLLERYYTEFRIYEIGLSQSSDIFTEQPNLRLECLFACLQATKSHGAALINIDPNQFPGLSALVTGQMTNCFACLCRLSTCEQSGWDRDIVNSTVDVSFFLQELEKKYSQVREAVGIDADDSGGSDYFTIKASKLRSMKASWDALTLTAISLQELESFSVDFLDACNW